MRASVSKFAIYPTIKSDFLDQESTGNLDGCVFEYVHDFAAVASIEMDPRRSFHEMCNEKALLCRKYALKIIVSSIERSSSISVIKQD